MINKKNFNAPNLIKAFVFVFSLLFCAEYFGKSLYSGSQDLENHLMLANTILKTRDFGAVPDFGSLQITMASYPPLSHLLAVWISPFLDNLLVALTKISVVATFIIYYIIFEYIQKLGKLYGFVFVALLAVSSYFGFGIIGNEVIGNFFYPQLISTLVAIIFAHLIIFENEFKRKSNFFICFFGLSIICFCIHPGPILCVLGGYLIKQFFLNVLMAPNRLSGILSLITLATTVGLIFYAIPYNKFLSKVALHNGYMSYAYLAGPETVLKAGYYFIICSLFLALFSCAAFCTYLPKTSGDLNYRITIASILGASSAISLIHLALILIEKSTFYSAKKNLFIIWTFFCILLALIMSDLLAKKFHLKSSTILKLKSKIAPILPIIFSLVIVCVIYRGAPVISIYTLDALGSECIKLQDSIGLNARQNTIVQLPIPHVFNYVLTSCYLNYPKRAVLWDILNDKIKSNLAGSNLYKNSVPTGQNFDYVISSSQDLLPPVPRSGNLLNLKGLKIQQSANYITEFLDPPSISPGEVLSMNVQKNTLIFQSGISGCEPWGTWSDGSHTRLRISVNKACDSNELVLFIQPFIVGARSQFEAYAEIGGKKKWRGEFSIKNAKQQAVEIPFCKNDINSSGILTVDLYYTNTMPCFKASGHASGDNRQLSFGFINVSIRKDNKSKKQQTQKDSCGIRFINWNFEKPTYECSSEISSGIEFNIESTDKFQRIIVQKIINSRKQKNHIIFNDNTALYEKIARNLGNIVEEDL